MLALGAAGTAWARGAQAGARAGLGVAGSWAQRARGRAEQAAAGARGAGAGSARAGRAGRARPGR